MGPAVVGVKVEMVEVIVSDWCLVVVVGWKEFLTGGGTNGKDYLAALIYDLYR